MTTTIQHPLAQGTEVNEADTYTFPEGLIGFPGMTRFALVPLPDAQPFRLLASLEEPAFGLVVVEPRLLVPDYELSLREEDLAPIEVGDPDRLQIVVAVKLPEGDRPFSLNLKAPLVLAPDSRQAVQRASSNESHAVSHVQRSEGTESTTCSS